MVEQKQKKKRLTKYYFLAAATLLIFLHLLGAFKIPENFLISATSGWQGGAYQFLVKLRYSFINFQEAQDLRKENEDLRSRYNQLLFANSQLESLRLENEKLRQLVNFGQASHFPILAARVIGRDFNQANTLIIDKGKNQGAQIGDPVVVDNGIMVGTIINCQDNLSFVLLASDNQSKIAVSTVAVDKAAGLASGEFGLSIKVDLIPQDVEIKEGDTIITSGSETKIPRGLVLGKVSRLTSKDNDLFKSATLSPLVDFNNLTYLNVILETK